MRIIAAPNAFKGSMTAMQAAAAMKKGILAANPDCDVVCVPVSDGGDGLTEILAQALSGTLIDETVKGPRMTKLSSQYCLAGDLAVIEMARASGLALLPTGQHNPTKTTSYGTGELIRAALNKGVRRIIIGLGGSATCDGGIGLATALGYRFLTKNGEEVEPTGGALQLIHSIDRSNIDKRLQETVIEAVCDVSNPLTGEFGASYVYSPQKGATAEQVALLDEGLENLADVIEQEFDINIRHMPGAGAAGGLGAGLHAFVGAELKKGIDLVIDVVRLKEKIRGADLVLTAEGQIDFQTKYDKAPAGVAYAAKQEGVPCIAVCGSVGERIDGLYDMGFTAVFSLCKGPQSLETAMSNGFDLLAQSVEQIIRTFMAATAH